MGVGEDLSGELLVVEVLVLRGARVQLRAIDREHRDADQAGVGAEREHVAEQAGQRRLVALAKARDRAVIGPLVGRDDAVGDVLLARALDGPRGALALGVGVEQERDHHRRVVGRAPVAVESVGGIERGQIHLLDRSEYEPREVILGQPIAQARGHQKRLLAVTRQEVLRHAGIVFSPPDGPPFVQQPRREAAVRRPLPLVARSDSEYSVVATAVGLAQMHGKRGSRARRFHPALDLQACSCVGYWVSVIPFQPLATRVAVEG